ncbi:hypothetical protein SAMN04244579_03276 [Azotobacter beijerinckii]|uniref:Uncharacterized protein n=2 Tax=Azotobacter beijerinckii TaxID=170623 RepID=A0A1H6WJU1_9GAMM|nr:hypothetical protein SAMN04244579_03276 [Azotobacter beijerinckii]
MDETRSAESRQIPNQQQTANLLQALFPPQSAILVGASQSNPNRLDWQSIPPENVLLIDAKQEALAGIKQNVALASDWQMRNAVLAESQGEAPFFSASNPGEDGLVPPQKLVSLWANLRPQGQRTCTTQTLQTLLSEPQLAPLASATNTWLVIDCLPALRILQGAGPLLKQWKVLWVRVLLAPLEDNEPGTTLAEIERYLADHDYRCIGCFEENHPHIGQAIFLHDTGDLNTPLAAAYDVLNAEKLTLLGERDALLLDKSALGAERDTLRQEKSNLLASCDTLGKEKAALVAARDEQTKLANERKAQIDALSREKADLLASRDTLIKEKTELAAARDALAKEKTALAATRDEQAKLANEHKTQLDALAKEKTALIAARDEQAKLANERKAQLDALAKGTAELVAIRDALVKEKTSLLAQLGEQTEKANALLLTRDNQTLILSERDSQIHQFEAEYSENLARLRLMQDELVKGEAQIELIKDLLLREPGL